MKILSFDVGIKNLAYCLIEVSDKDNKEHKILDWDIINCAEIGADIMTGPLKAIKALANHPLTDIGLEKFLADHAKGNK